MPLSTKVRIFGLAYVGTCNSVTKITLMVIFVEYSNSTCEIKSIVLFFDCLIKQVTL